MLKKIERLILMFLVLFFILQITIQPAGAEKTNTLSEGIFDSEVDVRGNNKPERPDMDDENNQIDPIAHPTLDIALEIGIFIFSYVAISFVVIFKKRTINFCKIQTKSLRVNKFIKLIQTL